MRGALVACGVVLAMACESSAPPPPVCEPGDDTRLFGRPNPSTGLDDSRCGPVCSCGGAPFVAPLYGDAEADALLAWELDQPYSLLAADPYADVATEPPPDGTVCAVIATGERRYRLAEYPSLAAARAAGAIPSHGGRCGLCSPLADLAVYLRYPDLTDPVRQCGLAGGDAGEHTACLRALGFTEPCAQIWYFNTLHTRDRCLLECLGALGQPYHQADGSLNECLVCDEVESGPVFKAVAGRTRRNTGVASAMCRPCDEVLPLVHVYE
jgi:hypothetical protein